MFDVVQDPTWCLHDVHVHMFLQIVVDHWSDYWGLSRFTLPDPAYTTSPVHSRMWARTKRLKDYELRQAAAPSPYVLASSTDDPSDEEGTAERRLYAAVLRKAILDWAGLQCSPQRADKRIALNCYWWFMGFPILLPRGAGRSDVQKIRGGQVKAYRLERTDNPFDALGVGVEALWSDEWGRVGYFPWRERDALARECVDLMSFETVSTVLDLRMTEVRKAIHLVSPLKMDEDD